MKKILGVFFYLFTFSVLAEPVVLEVLEQKGQKILIKHSSDYDNAKVTVDDEICNTDLEFFGAYSFIDVEKKFVQQKDKCILNQRVTKEKISLFKHPYDSSFSGMGFFYLGLGPSFINNGVELGEDLNSASFNYSIGYFKKGNDYLVGGIYHVSAFRVYGSVPNPKDPNQLDGYELQSNFNLLGVSFRKYWNSIRDASLYFRIDGGLAWTTVGSNILLGPFEESSGTNLGSNIGLGISLPSSWGAINLDLYQSIYKSDEVPAMEDTSITNFTVGIMF